MPTNHINKVLSRIHRIQHVWDKGEGGSSLDFHREKAYQPSYCGNPLNFLVEFQASRGFSNILWDYLGFSGAWGLLP